MSAPLSKHVFAIGGQGANPAFIWSGQANNRSKPIRAGTVAIDNSLAGAAGSGGVDGAAWVALLGLIESISTTPMTSVGYASANTRTVKPPAECPTTTYGPGISACCSNLCSS